MMMGILIFNLNYYSDREKSLIITPKTTKKIKNLRIKPNISFSIDNENFPHKGVKGKGIATVVDDPVRTVPEAKKIYINILEHSIILFLK